MPLSSHITPDPYRPPTRAEIERARAMYAQGFTVSRCLAACDMSLGTFYYWLDGGPREAGGSVYPPIARRRVVVGKRRKPLLTDRASLAARLWRTTERQARDIEERLARPGASSPERERDVRMLAMLVRTMRELAAFDSAGAIAAAGSASAAGEPAPDIDELRRSLAVRLEALVQEQEAGEGALSFPLPQGERESAPVASHDTPASPPLPLAASGGIERIR